MTKNLCIIPARGGSKRIPRKNIKDFLGKPIIAYSIEAALKSKLFDEVMVSTDDDEIAKVAIEYGAVVPFLRSTKNSDDFATLSDVIEEIKSQYTFNAVYFDSICCILPTAPMVTPELLKEGYHSLINSDADSVRPLARFHYPIQRALRLINEEISFFNEKHKKTRSQDLEPAFHDAGMFYWMIFSSGLLGEKKLGFEVDSMCCQDIDTIEDWEMAEFKYKYFK